MHPIGLIINGITITFTTTCPGRILASLGKKTSDVHCVRIVIQLETIDPKFQRDVDVLTLFSIASQFVGILEVKISH